jgi:hypothetical protein
LEAKHDRSPTKVGGIFCGSWFYEPRTTALVPRTTALVPRTTEPLAEEQNRSYKVNKSLFCFKFFILRLILFLNQFDPISILEIESN